MPSIPMTRSMRLLRGHRRRRAQESRTQIGSHRQHGQYQWQGRRTDKCEIHTATHQRPIVHLFVSRETCRRLQPHSIPTRTDVGLMTGEGTRCQPGDCTYPCTNRVGVTPIGSHMGALLPGTGVLRACGRRHHKSDSNGTHIMPAASPVCPQALRSVPTRRVAIDR